MPRKKRLHVKKISNISLDLDNADQRRFWEYYQYKSRTGEALRWIRDTMSASIPLNWKSQLAAQLRAQEATERLSGQILEIVSGENDGDDNDGAKAEE